MFSILLNVVSYKNRDDFKKLEELASSQDQVEVLHVQDKLGKQNFHENMRKVFESVTNTIKQNFPRFNKNHDVNF